MCRRRGSSRTTGGAAGSMIAKRTRRAAHPPPPPLHYRTKGAAYFRVAAAFRGAAKNGPWSTPVVRRCRGGLRRVGSRRRGRWGRRAGGGSGRRGRPDAGRGRGRSVRGRAAQRSAAGRARPPGPRKRPLRPRRPARVDRPVQAGRSAVRHNPDGLPSPCRRRPGRRGRSGPAAGRGTGVLLELEGPGIEAVRAPGFELYESKAPGRHRIIVAGSLEAGPLMRFRVPDRGRLPLYRVRVIEVTGEDYQLGDPGQYRAVVITD